MSRFARSFTACPEHIDELGHVNNAVWVQWIQDLATAHWEAAARPEDRAAYFWVVTRHEIDYRGNIDAGQSVTGETWIEGPARGDLFAPGRISRSRWQAACFFGDDLGNARPRDWPTGPCSARGANAFLLSGPRRQLRLRHWRLRE